MKQFACEWITLVSPWVPLGTEKALRKHQNHTLLSQVVASTEPASANTVTDQRKKWSRHHCRGDQSPNSWRTRSVFLLKRNSGYTIFIWSNLKLALFFYRKESLSLALHSWINIISCFTSFFPEHHVYASPLLSPLFNTSLRDAWAPALMSVSVTYAHRLTNFSTSRDGIWAEHERAKQEIPSLDGFLGFYICVHAQILPKKNRT